MLNTKEKILIAALHLFSQNGYEAVSVSQIAGELAMVKSALYKHYKNYIIRREETKRKIEITRAIGIKI